MLKIKLLLFVLPFIGSESFSQSQSSIDSIDAIIDGCNITINELLIDTKQVSEYNLGEASDYIQYKKNTWCGRENPIVVKYKGAEFGDYFHLQFGDSEDNYYDFGDGDNDLGEYQLYFDTEAEGLVTNEKYLNKTFRIYWGWKEKGFYCCSGEYEPVIAYMPSILKLEIVE